MGGAVGVGEGVTASDVAMSGVTTPAAGVDVWMLVGDGGGDIVAIMIGRGGTAGVGLGEAVV